MNEIRANAIIAYCAANAKAPEALNDLKIIKKKYDEKIVKGKNFKVQTGNWPNYVNTTMDVDLAYFSKIDVWDQSTGKVETINISGLPEEQDMSNKWAWGTSKTRPLSAYSWDVPGAREYTDTLSKYITREARHYKTSFDLVYIDGEPYVEICLYKLEFNGAKLDHKIPFERTKTWIFIDKDFDCYTSEGKLINPNYCEIPCTKQDANDMRFNYYSRMNYATNLDSLIARINKHPDNYGEICNIMGLPAVSKYSWFGDFAKRYEKARYMRVMATPATCKDLPGFDVSKYVPEDKETLRWVTFGNYIIGVNKSFLCYADNTKKPLIKTYTVRGGEWCRNSTKSDLNYKLTKYEGEEEVKKSCLRYFFDVLPDLKAAETWRYSNDIIWLQYVVRHPMIERMMKAGYKTLAAALACECLFNAAFKDYFGVGDPDSIKDKNLFRALNKSKYILDKLEAEASENAKGKDKNKWYNYGRGITPYCLPRTKYFNMIWDYDKLNQADKNTSDLVYDVASYVERYMDKRYYNRDNMFRYGNFLLRNASKSDLLRFKKLFIDINNDPKKEFSDEIVYLFDIYTTFADHYKPQDAQAATSRYYRPKFMPDEYFIYLPMSSIHQFSDVQRWHDVVQEGKLQGERQRIELEAENRKKLEENYAKKRLPELTSKYYSNDGEYVILPPNRGADISYEGISLGHCVGGYVDRHLKGDTTILFLRKASSPDKSWFTIEVTNSGYIQQIHGNGNRWLGTSPEAIPFMIKWINSVKVKCAKNVLTNKGMGYCGGGEYVDISNYEGVADSKYIY